MLEKSVGGALVAAAVFAVLALGLALAPQRLQADDGIRVPTRAQVVGPLEVAIDIEPCCRCNTIILTRSRLGTISVAIITTPQFDARTVDGRTVRFAGARAKSWKAVDVDRDRDKDLLLTFKTKETNLAPGDTQACLDGQTFDGVAIHGCDRLRVIGLVRWWSLFATGASVMGLNGSAPTLAVAEAALTPAPTGTPTAMPFSNAVALPPAGVDGGDLSTDGWPRFLLLVAVGLALTALVGSVSFFRPRHR